MIFGGNRTRGPVLALALLAGAFASAAPGAYASEQPDPAQPAVAAAGAVTEPPACATRSDLLGLARVVEIDTASAPHFGEQYKQVPFLNDGEVVLTFDDGPMRRYTIPILDALDAQCTKATFFSVGKMAISDPDTLQEVARRGHTIGTHTWSHAKLKSLSAAAATREIELGVSAVAAALGKPPAPFFRFPYLADTKGALAHLAGRGIATFGIEVDSRDFRTRNPGTVLRNVMSQLEKARKGIILFHDIQPSTAGALASLLGELKSHGFKVVHMVPKTPATTLPEYNAIAEKALAAKMIASKADPMAQRAVTWPVAAVNGADAAAAGSASSQSALPWLDATPAEAAPKPSTRKPAARKPATPADDDRWQIKALGE